MYFSKLNWFRDCIVRAILSGVLCSFDFLNVLVTSTHKRRGRFSNRNYNLVVEHRQHHIHIHAGTMTIIHHRNQPTLIHLQGANRKVDRFQSDPMYNTIYQSLVLFLPLSLWATQSPLTHLIQINIDRTPYHPHSTPIIQQFKSFLIHQSVIQQLFLNLCIHTNFTVTQLWDEVILYIIVIS